LAERDPKYTCFQKGAKDVIWFGKRLIIPANPDLKKEIFDEAHLSKFSIHLGSTDVSGFERKFLVVQHEGRHSKVCFRM
jgi:hypothetical protein